MSARKSGLGKGLDALIPSIPEESRLSVGDVNQVAIESIEIALGPRRKRKSEH